MNKIEGQNEVFRLIKEKYKKQGYISNDDVYSILTDFGFSPKDKEVRTKKHIFDFKGTVKTRGIILDVESLPFIPFSNGDVDKEKLETAVKMYIPVGAKDLTETYSSFKKFLDSNNIQSNSKARNRASSDDIVIRVYDIDTVNKVRNFIKDSKIKNSIKYSNPFFAHDEMGIGYSMDGNITSVNDELSKLLSSYVNANKDNIDGITRDGFKEFLHNSKTDYYKNYPYFSLFQSESDRIRNLIELSMDENFKYDDMVKYTSLVQGFKNNLKKMNIRNMSSLIYSELIKEHGEVNALNMMCHIDELQDSDFPSPFIHMLAKMYLTNELSLDYFSSMGNEEQGKNKKFV